MRDKLYVVTTEKHCWGKGETLNEAFTNASIYDRTQAMVYAFDTNVVTEAHVNGIDGGVSFTVEDDTTEGTKQYIRNTCYLGMFYVTPVKVRKTFTMEIDPDAGK